MNLNAVIANLKFINQKIKNLNQNVDLMAVTKNRTKEDVLNLINNGVKYLEKIEQRLMKNLVIYFL